MKPFDHSIDWSRAAFQKYVSFTLDTGSSGNPIFICNKVWALLTNPFYRLLEGGKYSDLVIVAADQEYLVHKCIVFGQCPMLEGRTQACEESFAPLELALGRLRGNFWLLIRLVCAGQYITC